MIREIRRIEEFRAAARARSRVLVTDGANGNKVHQLPSSHVTEAHFLQKVGRNRNKNGHYHELSRDERMPAGARPCRICRFDP